MKKIKKVHICSFLFIASLFVSLLSCSSDDTEGSGGLKIESVSLAVNDSLVTTGFVENMYIIRGSGFKGTQKIFFNNVQADFNPTLVTDKVIFVTIPLEAPFQNVGTSDKIRIETVNGDIEYDFVIGQPEPKITSFNPVAGGTGDIVTIKGTVFDNLISVKFDEIEALIVSSTSTEIKVEIPAGVVQAKIYVETAGGTAESPGSFGFKRIIYDDALGEGFQLWGGWGGTQDLQNTTPVKRGTYSIKRVTEGWSALQIGYSGSTLNLGTDVNAVKVSIYAETTGKVRIVFNGDDSHGKVLDVVAGQWIDFTIPVSEITSQTTLSQIWIQEFSGSGNVLYIDDFGFI